MTDQSQGSERYRPHWHLVATGLGAVGAALAAVLLFTPDARAQQTAEAGPEPLPFATQLELVPQYAAGVPIPGWERFREEGPTAGAGTGPGLQGPTQAEVLWESAVHSLYSGRRMKAYRAFRKAGDAATEAGDVFLAARANLRAAYVASRLDHPADAREAMERVRMLRDSPKLTMSQRRRLDVRIDRAETL